MTSYLTTYTKDYVWPSGFEPELVSVKQLKVNPQELDFLKSCLRRGKEQTCKCTCNQDAKQPGEQAVQNNDQAWSRIQVMGELLEPKIFPGDSNTGDSSAMESKMRQQNDMLEKLQNQYDVLFTMIQNKESSEQKMITERDRNKTTYQVDYCEGGPVPKTRKLELQAPTPGQGAGEPLHLPGDPCRVKQNNTSAKFGRSSAFTTLVAKTKVDPRPTFELSSGIPPMGKTDYQDGVSKLGGIIMRDKLHH